MAQARGNRRRRGDSDSFALEIGVACAAFADTAGSSASFSAPQNGLDVCHQSRSWRGLRRRANRHELAPEPRRAWPSRALVFGDTLTRWRLPECSVREVRSSTRRAFLKRSEPVSVVQREHVDSPTQASTPAARRSCVDGHVAGVDVVQRDSARNDRAFARARSRV
jgi:hypothetical protein